jgi:hypothetical protein
LDITSTILGAILSRYQMMNIMGSGVDREAYKHELGIVGCKVKPSQAKAEKGKVTQGRGTL